MFMTAALVLALQWTPEMALQEWPREIAPVCIEYCQEVNQ